MGIIGDLANKNLGIGSGFKDVQKDLINKADNISDDEKESLKADVDRSNFGTPSNWVNSVGPTIANKPQPEPEPEPPLPSISSYSPTAAKADWQKGLEDFISNQIGKWTDNVKNTFTPDNISSSTSEALEPLAKAVQDNIPIVSQLEQADKNKTERSNYENRLEDYAYLNELLEDDEDDPTYNGLTYGEAIDQIAQGMIGNPERELSDREKDIIRNRSDSWGNQWSLPYIAASDKAYRQAYNDRATRELGDDAALLKQQTFDYNFGPISFGAQDDNAMDSNTNYGFYIDPDSPARVEGEFNYQPYNNADDDTWAYAFGTDGGWGKNYLGEVANNVNNMFDATADFRSNLAKDNAKSQEDTVMLNDGNEVSLQELKEKAGFNGNFFDPSQVTAEEAEMLRNNGVQEIGDRDSSQMDPVYNLFVGADGTILPSNFDFDDVQFSPDYSQFYVTGYGPFDGTYSTDAWTTANSIYGTAAELGLSDEDAQSIVGNAPILYYEAVADPNDENSIRNNMQDFTMSDGQTVTADDVIKYLNNENVKSKDNGLFNVLKEDVDMPWKDGANLQTWAENIVPWFVDTGLGSWQTMVPVLRRVLGPLWAGSRAIADVQGLDVNNDNLRGDLSAGGGYTKDQQGLKALGDLADPFIEQVGGIGGKEGWVSKAIDKIGKYGGPVAKWAADTAEEGAEEAVTQAIQQAGNNPYLSDYGKTQEYDPTTKQYVITNDNEALQNIIDNFIGGALFSAPLNAASTGIDYAQHKDSYREKKDRIFHPRRTKYDKSLDYNLDEGWKSYYDRYQAGE